MSNMTVIPYKKMHPQLQDNVFIAPGAKVIGDTRLGTRVSIWFNTVLRGDVNCIQIGEYTNIQDNSTLHVMSERSCIVGAYVTVGHGVILHGCTIADNCLIGMGSIILNDAAIGENCIIGAGTLIPERKIIPPNSLVMGSPGKVIRQVTEEEARGIRESALHYGQLANEYR